MTARAFLFPGQGSQYVGMGLEAYRERGTIRDIFDRANDVLGYRLTEIMFNGPEEELRATRHAQPALFLHSYALFQLLQQPNPAMGAGHSLGEYTALSIAGALTFDDALQLVQLRANAMAQATESTQGTMGAVIGLDDSVVEEICSEIADSGNVVVPANFNSDGQVVVSGSSEGVTKALTQAKERGARMAKELNVSGAFHSPLMEPARKQLAEGLEKAPFRDAQFPVFLNVSAKGTTDSEEIRNSLLQQLTAPVRWTKSIKNMIEGGGSQFVEVGPGNVLQKLVGRISRDVTSLGIETLEQVNDFNNPEEK